MRFSIFFFIVFLLGFMWLGYMHERVHVEIFRHYGIESHVEYFSHFPDLITIPEENCQTEECLLANNINEIVGYPLIVLYSVFGIFCFIVIILKEEELIW